MVECTYEHARLNEPVTQEAARRIEEGRQALQDLKISLVNRLVIALQRGSALGLWNDCLQLITSSLTGSDADFYLEFDRLSGQWLASTGLDSTHNVVELNPGGLTEIFELIGYCEKELTIGTMDQVKTSLQPLLTSTSSIDYLAMLQSARRQKVDAALEAFTQFRNEEATFWCGFHDRVNDALRDDFYEEVVTRTRVRRSSAAQFEPHLRFFADWSRKALEQTGTLPQLPLLPVPESNYCFKREGKLWKLAYKGQEVHVKNRIGHQYLQYLLKRPGQEISVQTLVNAIQGNPVSRPKVSSAQGPMIFEEIGSTPDKAEDLGPLVDDEAKEQIRAKIRELDEEIEEANARGDDRRADACELEKDELLKYLSAAFGLGGRPRQVGSTTERARTAVRNAMVNALRDIKGVHPQLHDHLRSVTTGSFCRYDPPGGESPPWEF